MSSENSSRPYPIVSSSNRTFFDIPESSMSMTPPSLSALIRGREEEEVLAILEVSTDRLPPAAILSLLAIVAERRLLPLVEVIRVNPVAPVAKVLPLSLLSSSDSIMSPKTFHAPSLLLLPVPPSSAFYSFFLSALEASLRMYVTSLESLWGTKSATLSKPYVLANLLSMILILALNLPFPPVFHKTLHYLGEDGFERSRLGCRYADSHKSHGGLGNLSRKFVEEHYHRAQEGGDVTPNCVV